MNFVNTKLNDESSFTRNHNNIGDQQEQSIVLQNVLQIDNQAADYTVQDKLTLNTEHTVNGGTFDKAERGS